MCIIVKFLMSDYSPYIMSLYDNDFEDSFDDEFDNH